MKPVLVIIGTAIIEESKATFQSVDNVFYMDAEGQMPEIEGFERGEYIDSAESICEHMIENGYIDSYVIPSMFNGEVILPEGFELPPEYPEDFDWDLVVKYLPDYYHRDEVLHSDLMSRYVEIGEEGPEQSDIDWMLEGIPDMLLSNREWVYHQLCELDTQLFIEAMEAKKEDEQ